MKIKLTDKIVFGDGNIYIQTMGSYPYSQKEKLENQIKNISKTNCSIFRLSVRNLDEIDIANNLRLKYEREDFVFCADTHFNPKITLGCIDAGFKKIRINPGNMKNKDLTEIYNKASDKNIVIRIGLNGGSCRQILGKNPEVSDIIDLFNSFIKYSESCGFSNIVLSAKFSDYKFGIEVNRELSKKFQYPIHLGVTEAGDSISSIIKHSIYLEKLLHENIGDTIRISVTGDSEKEIIIANELLTIIGVKDGIELISCPTCGRTWGSLSSIVDEVRFLIDNYNSRYNFQQKIKIAIMGCEVNGPGEAADADFGISLTKNGAITFLKGNLDQKINKNQIIQEIEKFLKKMII